METFLVLFLVFIFSEGTAVSQDAETASTVSIMHEISPDEKKEETLDAWNISGRTFVPLESACRVMDIELSLSGSSRAALQKNGGRILIFLNSRKYEMDDRFQDLTQPPQLVRGVMCITIEDFKTLSGKLQKQDFASPDVSAEPQLKTEKKDTIIDGLNEDKIVLEHFADMKYFMETTKQKKLSANDKLFLLRKIYDKYKNTDIDLSILEKMIKEQEALKLKKAGERPSVKPAEKSAPVTAAKPPAEVSEKSSAASVVAPSAASTEKSSLSKSLSNDVLYYDKLLKQMKLPTPNDRLYVLYRIRKKYENTGIDFSELSKLVREQEQAREKEKNRNVSH